MFTKTLCLSTINRQQSTKFVTSQLFCVLKGNEGIIKFIFFSFLIPQSKDLPFGYAIAKNPSTLPLREFNLVHLYFGISLK